MTIRRGTADDARRCHDLRWASVTELGVRHGTPLEGTVDDRWPWLRLHPYVNDLMSDRPFGQFDRYIGFSPPIFL